MTDPTWLNQTVAELIAEIMPTLWRTSKKWPTPDMNNEITTERPKTTGQSHGNHHKQTMCNERRREAISGTLTPQTPG